MAKKQYLDLTGLTTYDEQIKSYIDSVDAATSTKLTSGTIVVKEAEHADTADSATIAGSATTAETCTGNAATATVASKLGSTSADTGSTTKPIYLKAGVATAGSTYAGGTKVTLNGSAKGGSTASFYAPTAAGTAGQILTSAGSGAPTWADAATARTNLDIYSKSEVDSALSGKSDSTHNHDSKYDAKGAAATAESNAKAYADSAATTVKNDLLN